jgi:hypothetical protein
MIEDLDDVFVALIIAALIYVILQLVRTGVL